MSGHVDIGPYLREYHEHGEILLRAKWTMDGAESLAEAADLLRMFADELEALEAAGFHLMAPIEHDHGFAHRGEDPLAQRPAADRRSRPLPELNEDPAGLPTN